MESWTVVDVLEWTWIEVARVQMRLACEVDRVRSGRPGQSTVEYALVGALVVIAAAGALTILGSEVSTVFNRITTTLSGAPSAGH